MTHRKLEPRLVNKTEAAHYCGLNVATFGAACTVRPIGLGLNGMVLRYDVQALDAWIDGLGTKPDDVDAMALLDLLGKKKTSFSGV